MKLEWFFTHSFHRYGHLSKLDSRDYVKKTPFKNVFSNLDNYVDYTFFFGDIVLSTPDIKYPTLSTQVYINPLTSGLHKPLITNKGKGQVPTLFNIPPYFTSLILSSLHFLAPIVLRTQIHVYSFVTQK